MWRRERLPIPGFWPGEFHCIAHRVAELDTIERVVSVAPNRKYERMTVFSSFSFKDVYFVSALTEFCGLSFQLKSVALRCCWDCGTANSGRIRANSDCRAPFVLGGKNHSGDAAVNLEFVLRPRVEPAHFTFTSLNPPPQPPTSQGATSRELDPKHYISEGLHSLLPPLLFLKKNPVWSRSRRVGHYFPSAVVPPTLSRGSLPQPAPAEGDARRARNYASGWGGGVVLAAARWRQRPELHRGLRRRVEIC